eukprot:Rhum_TRINITY_DN14524_c32_g1::Rhum_TRINITY_DN14524_c32_g1_i1::g.96798::m.96798
MHREAGASLDVCIPSSRSGHSTLSPRSPKSEQRAALPANSRRIVDHIRLNPLARPDLLPAHGGPQLRETASAPPLGAVDNGSFGHANLVSPKDRLRGLSSPREPRFDSTFSLTPKADGCTTSFALAQHPSETADGLGPPTPSARTLQQRQRRSGSGGGGGGGAPGRPWRSTPNAAPCRDPWGRG